MTNHLEIVARVLMSTTTKGHREFRDDNSVILHDKVVFGRLSNLTIILRIMGFITVMAVIFVCLLVT